MGAVHEPSPSTLPPSHDHATLAVRFPDVAWKRTDDPGRTVACSGTMRSWAGGGGSCSAVPCPQAAMAMAAIMLRISLRGILSSPPQVKLDTASSAGNAPFQRY